MRSLAEWTHQTSANKSFRINGSTLHTPGETGEPIGEELDQTLVV
ncbi:hypothetical protein RBSH_00066 [Rhodopirellula baltica SH28]|uniref:Uncharacterized protein n=1 Tax=Rhodopirellula baltica SH28 TaxID=993517 RepID=K5DD08_RHOBT|nr:hypothetical protein RBSH_00066 [Rhodopirellula baltica SH28]